MRERRWLLLTLYGLLLAFAVSDAIKASRAKFKIASSSTTTEEPAAEESSDDEVEVTTTTSIDTNGTTRHTLTGIPQIDYIWDPNLPRELNGYNLSDYPFYASIPNPDEIDFKCDGLHDGFYASVPHKCQVYHHCLYGTRYDFLCANFTAFDQRTFICHFVSEVDCVNSKKYWHRNNDLYKATTSSTTSTTTTTTTSTTTPAPPSIKNEDRYAIRDPPPRRRRPIMRRPAYDYYDEDDFYDDDEYDRRRGYNRRDYEDDYDVQDRKYNRRDRDRDYRGRHWDFRDRELNARDRFTGRATRRDPAARIRDPIGEDVRPRNRDRESTRIRDIEDRIRDINDPRAKDEYEDKDHLTGGSSTETLVKPAVPLSTLFKPRVPPKIRRPVPMSEKNKYAYTTTSTTTTTPAPIEEPRRRPVPGVPVEEEEDYYYDFEDMRPRWQMRGRPYRERDFDERYRDRNFRFRYRDEEEEMRPRKFPERPRDRYYDRDPERMIDRPRDRGKDRFVDHERMPPRSQDYDRPEKPLMYDREKENEHLRLSSKPKESAEVTEMPKKSIYDRTTTIKSVAASTSSSITTTQVYDDETVKSDIQPSQNKEFKERPPKYSMQVSQSKVETPLIQKQTQVSEQETQPLLKDSTDNSEDNTQKPMDDQKREEVSSAEYSSDEYYDEDEEPEATSPPPTRPPLKITKRPFLPSRGGNLNPRGLLPVGAKAPQATPRKEDSLTTVKPIFKLQTTSQGYTAIVKQQTTPLPNNYDGIGKSEDHDSSQDRERALHKPFYNNSFKSINFGDGLAKSKPAQMYQQPPKPQNMFQNPYQQPTTYHPAKSDNQNNRHTSRRPEHDASKKRPDNRPSLLTEKSTTNWAELQTTDIKNEPIKKKQSTPIAIESSSTSYRI